MTTNGVVDVHASGYHSAGADQWQHLGQTIADRGATIAAFTECRLRVVPTGWGQYVPARDHYPAECSIGWDNDAWECLATGYTLVSTVPFRRGNGDSRPGVTATWVVLRRRWPDGRKGYTLLRVVAHMPSSVQRGRRWSTKDARVKSWKAARTGLGKTVRQLRREHKATAVTVSCDFNIDLKARSWGEQLTDRWAFRGLRLVTARRGKGSHGRRLIDAHLTSLPGRRRAAKVMGAVKGFDHRPVMASLRGPRGSALLHSQPFQQMASPK